MNNAPVFVDALLLRASLQDLRRRLGEDWIGQLRAVYPEAVSWRFAHQAQHNLLYGYLMLPRKLPLEEVVWRAWRARLAELGLAGAELHRLEKRLDVPGVSQGQEPHAHYVVETDADEGWMEEIERWYAVEHLPGLASVPGCIRAQRWTNHDGGPRSLACYDLVSESTLGSVPWLAVRGTPWSDRTRPHFRNTRRTMFQPLSAQG
ncbi:hypothetical protein [Hylemonella gracilis]|uniref:Uncharacterized protein n=1 Tax=Hylemonella gracilis ATCC 19624 TaxID=887062 RepID=F3KUP9_9BURK|nr:hypothetical protein [Hylemonella gracilis]EGI76479.1 hypothetical protein HGR_10917 [Hylemonella gracilis ATCC 19624]